MSQWYVEKLVWCLVLQRTEACTRRYCSQKMLESRTRDVARLEWRSGEEREEGVKASFYTKGEAGPL
jgi:hypothetical protein